MIVLVILLVPFAFVYNFAMWGFVGRGLAAERDERGRGVGREAEVERLRRSWSKQPISRGKKMSRVKIVKSCQERMMSSHLKFSASAACLCSCWLSFKQFFFPKITQLRRE